MKSIYNNALTKMIFIGSVILFIASPVPAIPPDPDNAALLYYQGFLSLVKLDEEARDHIGDVARGKVAPDDKVRQDIGKCIGAIKFAEAASRVPFCNWGIRYSQGFECLLPQMAQTRFLTFVLAADARIRASDGDYREALERCLMIGTLARHVGNDTTISYLVSVAVRELESRCIRDVLVQASEDMELMRWLKNEIVTTQVENISPVRPLKIEMELVTDLMRMENVEKMAQAMVVNDLDKKKINEIVKTSNAKTLEQARRIYSQRMNSAMEILSTPMPYEQAYAQLKQLADDFDQDDPAARTAGAFIPALAKIYAQDSMRRTSFNAIIIAIEIYISRIKTGKLPDELPKDMPKDLFSDKPFEYRKTADGFMLRSRGREQSKGEIYEYEFKVK